MNILNFEIDNNQKLLRSYEDYALKNPGDLIVEPELHLATLRSQPLELTPNEFAILATLMENRGRALSRSQLIGLALGYDYEGLERTADVYIRHLRRKI